jgi:hypothetical protein
MAINFYSAINLNENSLQKAVIHPLSSAPSGPSEGQIYYNNSSGNKSLYVYNGSAWITVGQNSISTLTVETTVASGDKVAFSDESETGDINNSITIDNLLGASLNFVSEAAVANGDYVLFLDGGSSGTAKKEAVHDLATLFAGSGLTATNSVIAVDTLNQDTSGTAALATSVTITDNNATNETTYLTFVDGATGTQGLETEDDLTYNPSTGLLSSTGVTASGTVTYGSLSDGSITVTAFVDEDDMSSDSATLVPTQQSVKAYVDNNITSGAMTAFIIEDDDGTEVSVSNAEEIKFIGSGITTNWTDTSTGSDGDPFDMTFTVDAAQTGITSLLATDIKIGEDDQTKIDFETADTINFYAGNEKQLILTDGALTPGADNILDLGSSGVEFKDAFFDGTVTSDAFAGPLTGDVTGNADTATVATTVTITDNESTDEDNAIIFTAGGDVDGGNIGLESDGTLTYNPSTGKVTATGFVGTLTGAVTGNVTGTASLATVTNSTANTNFPVVFNNESDALLDDTGALYYNPSTGLLTVPNLSVAGTTTQVNTVTMNAQNAVVFEGATADAYETTLTIVDPLADQTIYLPDAGGYIPLIADASTADGAVTAAEFALLDGGSTVATGAFADGDGLLHNDGGTMKQTNVSSLATLFAGAGMTASSSVVNVIGGDGITANSNDIAVTAAQTTITSLLATDIKIGEDDQTKIDFETANEIHFYANNTEQVYLADNIFGPQSDSDVDLGATGVRWKDAYMDNLYVTSDVDINGDVDVDGTLETDALTIAGTAIVAQSTTSAVGGVELATAAEVITGTDAARVVTADTLSAKSVVATIVQASLTDDFIVTITHNLGTADVIVELYDMDTEATVYADVYRTAADLSTASTSVISIDFGTAPADSASDIRCLITSLAGATAGSLAYT